MDEDIKKRIETMEKEDYIFPKAFEKRDYIFTGIVILLCIAAVIWGGTL